MKARGCRAGVRFVFAALFVAAALMVVGPIATATAPAANSSNDSQLAAQVADTSGTSCRPNDFTVATQGVQLTAGQDYVMKATSRTIGTIQLLHSDTAAHTNGIFSEGWVINRDGTWTNSTGGSYTTVALGVNVYWDWARLVSQTNISATDFTVVVKIHVDTGLTWYLFDTGSSSTETDMTQTGTTGYVTSGLCGAAKLNYVYNASATMLPSGTPGSLTATRHSGTQIDLTWTSATGATGYSLYVAPTSLAIVNPMNSSLYSYAGHVDGTSATIGGLGDSTSWFFRVVPTNSVGAGTPSSEVNTTVLAKPTWPFQLVTNRSTGVNLSWSQHPDAGVTNYQVWRDGVRVANVSPLPQPSWADNYPNVTPGISHTYALSAFVSATGESNVTGTSTGHMLQTVTSTVAGFTVTNQSGALRLDWAATSDSNATGFRIYRNASLDVVADFVTNAATTWSDTNVSPSVTYTYSMQFRSADSFGTPITGPLLGMLAVDAPHHFMVTNASASVVLTWDASLDSNTTSYDVLRNGSLFASVNVPTGTYSDTTGAAGVNYSYSVDARVNANLSSPATASQSGHRVNTPTTVGGVTAAIVQNGIRVSWTPNVEPDLLYYAVYRSTLPNVTPTTNLLTSTTLASIIDTTGHAGQRYYYRVEAVNTAGDASTPSLDATNVFPAASGGAGGGGGASVPPAGGGATSSQPASVGTSAGGSALAAAGSRLTEKGIHIPKPNPIELTWWQFGLLLVGFVLIAASLPYSRDVFGHFAIPANSAALGVLSGVALWSVVFIPLLFR